MNSDGTGLTQLLGSATSTDNFWPGWLSAQRIAFTNLQTLYRVNSDGSNQTQLTTKKSTVFRLLSLSSV